MIDQHLRVFQITESLNAGHGGLATACARLSGHLSSAGAEVTVASVDGAGPDRCEVPTDPNVKRVTCTPWPPRRFGYSPGLGTAMTAAAPAVVHAHGLWRLYLAQAARFGAEHGTPLIISTHGMLHGPARKQRGTLKTIARWLGQDDLLAHASCLHATAHEEAEEIRSLGFRMPIAVIPWGVDLPAAPAPAVARNRSVLFLGRFHPTKGLDALLRSWARVSNRFASARLVLAGYDDDGFRAQFEALAESLGISRSVVFEGAVSGAAREELFAGASVLALPSPSENFGFVVPEALVRGVPVIATQGTPWSSLVAERCGWWVPAHEDALTAALSEALDSSPAALQEMGERGRTFARAMFDWRRVADAMLTLYAWTLGGGPAPSFILRS